MLMRTCLWSLIRVEMSGDARQGKDTASSEGARAVSELELINDQGENPAASNAACTCGRY